MFIHLSGRTVVDLNLPFKAVYRHRIRIQHFYNSNPKTLPFGAICLVKLRRIVFRAHFLSIIRPFEV